MIPGIRQRVNAGASGQALRRQSMSGETRNVFISHIHEDDEGLADLKDLASRHGMNLRDSSITKGKFNNASDPDYIKYEILGPHIRWASVLVVYVSPETKNHPWVDWEIEYAHKLGKRIVGVWERGARDCELPEPLKDYADAVVGWNGESIIDAISGDSDEWRPHLTQPRRVGARLSKHQAPFL